MLTLMLTIRKNSKFFSKFLIGFLSNTKNFENVELLILANKDDTWNQDLFKYYKLNVIYEDMKCGKNGRHYFYNELAKHAKGDWLWHMCDDHYLSFYGYDEYLTNYIKEKQLDPNKVHQIVPRVENSGSIAHILSRGYYEAVGRIGAHGNIDSYLNRVAESMVYQERIHHPDTPILIDYTVDPSIMTPEHCKVELTNDLPVYDFESLETKKEIETDAFKLYNAIREGK